MFKTQVDVYVYYANFTHNLYGMCFVRLGSVILGYRFLTDKTAACLHSQTIYCTDVTKRTVELRQAYIITSGFSVTENITFC